MASWDGKLFLKSAHCARESCLSETRFLKKSKQKTSFRRVGCDIRGSSSVLPQNPACIFTDNQKTITRCSGIPQTPTIFPSLSNFCLCCHRDVPPTSKVHNINGIIQFSSSFEGDEPSTCCFTSNKKSCPRMKSGGSTGNDFLVKNLILPRARPPQQTIPPAANLCHTLQPFLRTEGAGVSHLIRGFTSTALRCQGSQQLKPMLSLDLQTAQR